MRSAGLSLVEEASIRILAASVSSFPIEYKFAENTVSFACLFSSKVPSIARSLSSFLIFSFSAHFEARNLSLNVSNCFPSSILKSLLLVCSWIDYVTWSLLHSLAIFASSEWLCIQFLLVELERIRIFPHSGSYCGKVELCWNPIRSLDSLSQPLPLLGNIILVSYNCRYWYSSLIHL